MNKYPSKYLRLRDLEASNLSSNIEMFLFFSMITFFSVTLLYAFVVSFIQASQSI